MRICLRFVLIEEILGDWYEIVFFYFWLLNSICSKIRLDKVYYCDIGYVGVSMYGALRLFTC